MLHILQGPDRGKRISLPEGEPQLIGRSSEALPISDRSVSRRHAELTPDDGRWFLRDLSSANGTFVNGERITDRTELRPGDQIRCGSTLIIFSRGKPDQDAKTSAVSIIDPELFDVTVESRSDSPGDSMVLGEPDPVRAAMQHLRVVYDLTALTATTFNRDELLERIMDMIFQQFRPDRGFILLMEGPEATPEPAVVRYRERPKTVDEGRIPVSRTIIQHAITGGQGILSTNAMNDTRFRSGDSVHNYGIRSAICVPIKAADRIFGVIHIDSSVANFTFTESQLKLMNAIGQHTGLVLMSSQLVSAAMQKERLAAVGEAVASLSHAIRNIIQSLRGGADAVELALSRENLNLAREGWPILSRNLDRIYALTLNMLAYSKQRSLEIELAPLKPLIEEVAALLGPQCERKRITLLVDVAEDMPPIPMDVNAMHQALMNLVTNAAEAAPDKTGRITIRARYEARSREAEIAVIDNGPGIDPAQHERIFEPFVSTKGQRGTGLGLAVTKKLIEDHGGRITLESGPSGSLASPGAGATFTIRLPSDLRSGDPSETKLPRHPPRPPS